MAQHRLTAEERKLAIIEAALPLFAEKGFAETTTRDLARAAGVSEPLLYRHFPSKEALYAEIQNLNCRATDPIARKLKRLKPSSATLVHLVYFLMKTFIMERPSEVVSWRTRFRLMVNSFLEDGAYARLMHQTRFKPFCSHMEACVKAAIKAGDVVPPPFKTNNVAYFTHHLGAWIALTNLPDEPTLRYHAKEEELVEQACWFALRGIGMTDAAIRTHFHPEALALFLNA